MIDVIDLCSDEDLPEQKAPPKNQPQKLAKCAQQNPPKPTNAKGPVRSEPREGNSQPSGNDPTSSVDSKAHGQTGAATSTSSRCSQKAQPNGATAALSTTQHLPSSGFPIPRADRDRASVSKASRVPKPVADETLQRRRFLLLPGKRASGSGPPVLVQERGHKRAHNANTSGLKSSHSLEALRQARVPGIGGNIPSGKSLSNRPNPGLKATAIDAFGTVGLTSDKDEPPPKKSRNDELRVESYTATTITTLSSSSTSSSSSSRKTKVHVLPPNEPHEHRNRPATAASSSTTVREAAVGLIVGDSPSPSPRHQATEGSNITVLSSSAPRSVHPSVEHSADTPGRPYGTLRIPCFSNSATLLGRHSSLGSTPAKSRNSSQRSFVGETSTRPSETRERRSTIPESPPLSPILDEEVLTSLSNTANSRRLSASPISRPKSSAASGDDEDLIKDMRNDENNESSGVAPSKGLCNIRMDQPHKPEHHAGKSNTLVVSPESRSCRLSNHPCSAYATTQQGTQAPLTSLSLHALDVDHNTEALLISNAHAQHSRVEQAAPKAPGQPEPEGSQDQEAETSRDGPPATASVPNVTGDGRKLASVEQPKQPLLALSNRNLQPGARTKSPQVASSRDVLSRSAQPVDSPAIERAVGQYIEEMRGDNEHWTRIELQRARVSNQLGAKVDTARNATSVFSRIAPIPLRPLHKKGVPGDCARMTTELHPITSKTQRVSYIAQYTTYDTRETVQVPNHHHYVSISNNLLANNVTSLQHWPYFGDDFDMDQALNLKTEYYMDVDDRERKLLRLGQAEGFAPYAEDLIQDVNCGWPDILHFLLDPEPDVGTSPDARKALRERENFISEDFIRDGERWGKVLKRLPAPSPDRVGRAAVLCDHFQRIANFSLWHLVRRSAYTKRLVAEPMDVQDEGQLTCRVCMRFNCPYHGEIKDHPSGQGPADNQVVETDIILPQVVNYRTRMPFPAAVDSEPVGPDKRRTLEYWEKGPFGNLKWKADERDPFYPCHHPGIFCSDARCSCFDARVACEKSCSCGPGCRRKWKGCSCHSGKRPKGKFVCYDDERCACWQLSRECDPDLCGDCGVADVLDPLHRHDDRILQNRCRLASLQRGVAKHTIIGDSGVHGLGLYACEDIRSDEFVGEYKGETITKEEAERRGAVYVHQKFSYLFSLNRKQEIDSAYFGNKTRFINHVQESKANLKPALTMVNTVFRIGLYARKHIRAGEELFFDYGPQFPRDQLAGNKSSKWTATKAPRARVNPNNFHEVNLVRDQEGRVRATKKASGTRPASSEDDEEDVLRRPGHPRGSRGKHHRSALLDTSSSGSKQHGGAGRPRKALEAIDDAHAEDPTINMADEVQGSGRDTRASDDDRMDVEHRLSMYDVLEDSSSADDDDFEPEPEEDSLSEVEAMSSAEE